MTLGSDREQLLKRDGEWAKAASEGRDVDRIVSYWTDDGVVLAPGMPAVVGKKAIRAYVQDSLRIPGFKIGWKSTDVTVSSDGTFAYMFGRTSMTRNGPDGTPRTTAVRGVTIWRRDSDGKWRCAVDIWNSEAPA